MNPGILAFVLDAWSGCVQAGWGSDLWLSAVVLWNSAPHVSTMLGSNLDLSDLVLDILQLHAFLSYKRGTLQLLCTQHILMHGIHQIRPAKQCMPALPSMVFVVKHSHTFRHRFTYCRDALHIPHKHHIYSIINKHKTEKHIGEV